MKNIKDYNVSGEFTMLEELANMKLDKKMRELFIELYLKGMKGKFEQIKDLK